MDRFNTPMRKTNQSLFVSHCCWKVTAQSWKNKILQMCSKLGPQYTGGLSRIYCTFCPGAVSIGSSFPCDTEIDERFTNWMDGYLNCQVDLIDARAGIYNNCTAPLPVVASNQLSIARLISILFALMLPDTSKTVSASVCLCDFKGI